MAFPTIPTTGAGRLLTVTQANTTATRTFPNLSSLTKNSGDLLIAFVVGYQSSLTSNIFSSWGGGFTEFHDSGGTSQMCVGIAYKWSTGSETGTFTVTQGGTVTGHAAMILMSIPGAHLSTPPEAGSRAVGTTSNADPAAFDPAGWGAEDTLWICMAGCGETGTGGAFQGLAGAGGGNPDNYGDNAPTGISADVVGGVEGGAYFRQLNTSSEDCGPISADTSNARNVAVMVAVRPFTVTTVNGSFTANAVIKSTIAASFTANAIIKSTIAASLTANAVIKGTIASSFSADAILSIILLNDTFTRTVGEGLGTSPQGHTYHLHNVETDISGVDTTQVNGSEVLVYEAGAKIEDAFYGYPLITYGTIQFDIYLPADETWWVGVIVDAWPHGQALHVYPNDGILFESGSSGASYYLGAGDPNTGPASVWYRVKTAIVPQNQPVWIKAWARDSETEPLLPNATDPTQSDDIPFVSRARFHLETQPHTYADPNTEALRVDNLIITSFTSGWVMMDLVTANAVISVPVWGFTANAVIKATVAAGFTANAVIKATVAASFTADAIIKRTLPAPHFVGSGTQSTGTTTTTPTKPAGTQSGDLLLLHHLIVASGTVTTPTGWTLLYSDSNASTYHVFGRIADGSSDDEPTVTSTFFASLPRISRIYGFRSIYTGAGVSGSYETTGRTTANSSTVSAPSLTTTDARRLAAAAITLSGPLSTEFTGETGGDWTLAGSFSDSLLLNAAWLPTATTLAGGSISLSSSGVWNVRALALLPSAIATDAIIKGTQGASFTANAVLKSTVAVSFTADAYLNTTASFTADAVIKATIAASFTADAILFDTEAATFTADAIVLRNQVASLGADAVVLSTIDAVFTTNAIVFRTQVHSFTVDAIIRHTSEVAISADAFVQPYFWADAFIAGRLEADAVILRTTEDSYSAAAWILGEGLSAFSADAIVFATLEKFFVADSIQEATLSATLTADAVLLQAWTASLVADAVIEATQVASLTADAVQLKTIEGSFAADAVILASRTVGFSADAVLFSTRSASFTADAVVKTTQSASFIVDAVLRAETTAGLSSNAIVLATQSASFVADAVLHAVVEASFVADASITAQANLSFTADAVVEATIGASFVADAVIQASSTAGYTADAIVRTSVTGGMTADSIVRSTIQGSWTADAAIQRTQSTSFTADAAIQRTQPGSLTADAVLKSTPSASVPADAFITSPDATVGSFSADAVIQATIAASLSADAVHRSTFVNSIPSDAILRVHREGSFAADAVLKATRTASLAAGSILFATAERAISADAIVRTTTTASLSADAWLQGVVSAIFTADGFIQPYFTANAVLIGFIPAGRFEATVSAATHGTTLSATTLATTLSTTTLGTTLS